MPVPDALLGAISSLNSEGIFSRGINASSYPLPSQQHLPERWENTVIVVPGGCQVGSACVCGVQAPCSLEAWGEWGVTETLCP